MQQKTAIANTDKMGSMEMIAPGVTGLRIVMVNVFFVGDSTNKNKPWILIDAGLRGSAGRIKKAAEARFGKGTQPAAIVLTHGHFDHVGALHDLLKIWDVPVYAHELEMPFLTGKSHYPPPDPTVGGGAMSLLSWLYPSSPIDLGFRVKPFPSDGTLPGFPEWQIIHTPGHTSGHVSFFREHDRTLIAGDAFVTTNQESLFCVITQKKQIYRPPAYFTSNWQAAERSVEKLAALNPAIVAAGHGRAMSGEMMQEELQHFVRNFYNDYVPAHGRYVLQPARTDEEGIVFLPPPVPNTTSKVMAVLGLALLAGAALITIATQQPGRTITGKHHSS